MNRWVGLLDRRHTRQVGNFALAGSCDGRSVRRDRGLAAGADRIDSCDHFSKSLTNCSTASSVFGWLHI